MKRTTARQQKNQVASQARVSAEQLEESGGPDILGLLKFGSQAMLKQAIEEEISQHLGRESYERLKENQTYGVIETVTGKRRSILRSAR